MGNMNPSRVLESDNVYGIVDSRYPRRIIDAFGDVNKSYLDETWRAGDFTVTASGTSPITQSVLAGAIALVTTGGTEYDGDNIQEVGTKYALAAGKALYFGAKLTLSDATQSDLVVGLAGTDTTLTASSSAHALNVGAGLIGFTKLDGATQCYFKTITTATEANSAAAFTMDTSAHIYEFYWDGYVLYGYIDGTLIATFASGVTSAVVTPSIAVRTGETAAKTLTIHWMKCFQARS
jgi:uncharacterized membrane protein